MSKLTSIFICLLIGINIFSQEITDTFRYASLLYKYAAFKEQNWLTNERGSFLQNKKIPYNSFDNFIGSLVIAEKEFQKFLSGDAINLPTQLYISNCQVIPGDTPLSNFITNMPDSLKGYTFGTNYSWVKCNGGLTINNCTSEIPLTVKAVAVPGNKSFTIYQNKMPWLELDSVKSRSLYFTDNKIVQLTVSGSDIDDLYLNGNSAFAGDTMNIVSRGSTFNTINVTGFSTDHLYASFAKCKIQKSFFQVDSTANSETDYLSYSKDILSGTGKDRKKTLHVFFDRCDINAELSGSKYSRRSNYSFYNCAFGEEAGIQALLFDTLIIAGCYKIMAPLYLAIPDSSDVYISIVNSDLKNINFDYQKNVHLLVDIGSTANEDLISHTYISLLEKFKSEGKLKSYENLDVEYKQWKYKRKGVFGYIANAIDRYWWYYGYRKGYIIFWTIAFMIFFTVMNFILWNKFTEVYEAHGKYNESYFEKLNYRNILLKKLLLVFLTTSFVFLSFHIELSRLNFRKSLMLIYFFVQYILGLVCLFFILNAVLKL